MAKAEYRNAIRSKKLINAALADLLTEKPLDKITVTEICDFADVNRSTYYTYFSDPFDQIIQYEKSIGEYIRDQLEEALKDDMSKQEKCFTLFSTALTELGKIKDDFKVLVSGKIDLSILKDILDDFWEPVFFSKEGAFEDLNITDRYRFFYAASGCFMMISNWFTEDSVNQISAEELANMLTKFSMNCYNFEYEE